MNLVHAFALSPARATSLWQFEVSDDQDSVQMLTRSSQVGEFYVMGPPEITKAGDRNFMDIVIYNEEADRHVRITWEEALKATLAVKLANDGSISDDLPDTGGGVQPPFVDEAARRAYTAAEAAYAAAKAAATTVAEATAAQNTRDNAQAPHLKSWIKAAKDWNTMNKADTGYNRTTAAAIPKVYIVIARPFIEHLMHSAVVAVAGRDTGATLFGPAGAFLPRAPNSPHPTLSRRLTTPHPRVHRHADLGQHPGQNHRGSLYVRPQPTRTLGPCPLFLTVAHALANVRHPPPSPPIAAAVTSSRSSPSPRTSSSCATSPAPATSREATATSSR